MKNINCLVCRSSKKKLFRKQNFHDSYLAQIDDTYQSKNREIYVCLVCGFVFHSPVLDAKDQRLLYKRFRNLGLLNESPDSYFDRITTLAPTESENHQKISCISTRIKDFLFRGGTLLDIGCGGGVFIYTFNSLYPNWKAYGIEPTKIFSHLTKRRTGANVVTGVYRPRIFSECKFDLIFAIQVLEHVLNPVKFLEKIKHDLKPGGYIYLEVPDISDFKRLPETHDRFMMQHLWFFSENSLKNICALANLEIKHIWKVLTIRQKCNLCALVKINKARHTQPLSIDNPHKLFEG